MLEGKNTLMNSSFSLRNSIQINRKTDDVKLVIHGHEKKLSQDTFESTMYQKQAKWLLWLLESKTES